MRFLRFWTDFNMSNNFFTYFIRCEGNKLYCGYTDDVEKRFKMHLSGKGAKYTHANKPIEIAYIRVFNTKSEAMKHEIALKKLTKLQKEKLCDKYTDYKNTEKILLEKIKNRPDLCKKCGKCCKVVVAKYSYHDLLKQKENGDFFAHDFLRIFEPYETIEEAKKADSEVVENILKNYNENFSPTFYRCKFLKEDNTCLNYKNRPLLCKLAPNSAWGVFPPNCGYQSWIFEKKKKKY